MNERAGYGFGLVTGGTLVLVVLVGLSVAVAQAAWWSWLFGALAGAVLVVSFTGRWCDCDGGDEDMP